jgi:hypothetical protein
VIPPDHLVRQIELLNLSWVHIELAPYHSHMGRLSIDPVLMDPDFPRRLIVVCAAPNRRICAEIQVNLAYRWFCKLGIEDKIPDHSAFCRARHERFQESDALRRFEGVVANVHCRRAFVAAKPRNDVAPVFKYDRSRKEISIDFAFG